VAAAAKSRGPSAVTVRVVEHAEMGLLLAGEADGDPEPSKTSSA
jgi:hypothetical protein